MVPSNKNANVALAGIARESTPPSETDFLTLRTSLAKALCRQHIMWPQENLPCDNDTRCDKQDQCIQLANEILDYRDTLHERD